MNAFTLALFALLVGCVSTQTPQDGSVVLKTQQDETTYAFSVLARGPAQGSYSLVVSKKGASGTSRSNQSGAFDVAGGAADTLSVSRINAASGDSVTAELVVSWSDGRTTTEVFEQAAQ